MSSTNYRLTWVTSSGIHRELYFGTPNLLAAHERRIIKAFGYLCKSALWDGSKWIYYVRVGTKILTLSDVRNLLYRLS